MRLVEEITVEVPDKLVYVDYLTLDPTVRDGKITLKAKSKAFCDWMKSIQLDGSKPSTSNKWGGTYYNIQYERVIGIGEAWIDGVGVDQLVKPTPGGNQVINLSWLRHTKLDEGIEIDFTPLISMADYEDFMPNVAQVLKKLYLNNIRQEILTLRMHEVL